VGNGSANGSGPLGKAADGGKPKNNKVDENHGKTRPSAHKTINSMGFSTRTVNLTTGYHNNTRTQAG
jgi:hypothetical protein